MPRLDAITCVFAVAANTFAAVINPSSWWSAFNTAACCVSVGVFLYFRRQRRQIARHLHVALGELAPRPRNVRVLRADGDVVNCELVFLGTEGEGDAMHYHWLIAGMVLGPDDQVCADLPPHTGLSFAG